MDLRPCLLLGGRTNSSGNPWCTLGLGTDSSVCGYAVSASSPQGIASVNSNQIVVYLVHHGESLVLPSGFYCLPVEIVEHISNAGCVSVIPFHIACCSSLDHLDRVDLLVCVRVPTELECSRWGLTIVL